MAGEETLNFTGGRKVNIRTMKADISAFLEETKPSLVQLISTQVEAERSSLEVDKSRHRLNVALAVVISLVFLGGIGFFAWQKFFLPEGSRMPAAVIPRPFFSVETSTTIEHLPRGTATFREKIRAAAVESAKTGTIRRIVAIDSDETGIRALDGAALLNEAGIRLPDEATRAITGPVMIVAHKIPEGTRLAIIAKTADPGRVFESLFRNESTLFRDTPGLFLSEPARPEKLVYEDRDYRNLSYRDTVIDQAGDLHIIYGIFPAKGYIIIASSKQSYQQIVNRLFEGS